MSLSLSTLRTEVREQLGVDSDDLNDTRLDSFLNRSYWWVLNKFDFKEKDDSYDLVTVEGTRDYTIPVDFDAVKRLYIPGDGQNAPDKIDQITEDTYAELYVVDSTNAYAKPQKYVRYSDKIRLWPTPDDEYTIVVEHLAILSDIPSDGPAIPKEWHEIILMGAVWRGHFAMREYEKGYIVKNAMNSLVEETVPVKSKEESDNRYAAISIPIPRNKF